ncbi:MAG: hypothetical protein J6B90_05480 [Lachnospiraceae bacterium]|nr:hypothetical protein [Lachnospiraceae bacterium]
MLLFLIDVWDIVTSLENNQWRSDSSKIEVINETQFVEYTKDGYYESCIVGLEGNQIEITE